MTYYVYRDHVSVGNVTEVAYIVSDASWEAGQGMSDDLVSRHETEAEAISEAKSAAKAESSGLNEGYRWADLVPGMEDRVSEWRLLYGRGAEVLLAGAGQPCADGDVADVLGSDARDLMEGVEAASVAVAEVLSNTGRWVTEGQYLLRLRNLHATHGGDEDLAEWARRHGAGEGLVAELVSSAK